MVTVTVAGESKPLGQVSERWITRTVNRAKRQSLPVCIQVAIAEGGLRMRLSTPACGGQVSGGRPPNDSEADIFELWSQQDLDTENFHGGNLLAFLKQLQQRHL